MGGRDCHRVNQGCYFKRKQRYVNLVERIMIICYFINRASKKKLLFLVKLILSNWIKSLRTLKTCQSLHIISIRYLLFRLCECGGRYELGLLGKLLIVGCNFLAMYAVLGHFDIFVSVIFAKESSFWHLFLSQI